MYSVSQVKNKIIDKKVDSYEILGLEGFIMSSKNGFKINNQTITNIKVIDNEIAYSLVYNKVKRKYNKLIQRLTDLITSDDDSGDDIREALNQIERFRLEIKNKYRNYLRKKELEKMSRELQSLKKEASLRLIEMNSNISSLSNGKSR